MTCRLLPFLSFLFLPWIAYGQTAPDSGAVVLNELQYAPSDGRSEFIELYNRSESAVNLARLEIADATRDYTTVASSDTLLAPGGYVVLVEDSALFASAFPDPDVIVPPDWPALNNGGDKVLLRDGRSGTHIDAVSYDPSWGGDDGHSLERIDPNGPSDRASNFGSSIAERRATPAAENSIFALDTTPPSLQRARPMVAGDSVVAHFSEPVDAASIAASAFHLDAPTAPAIANATVSDTAASVVHLRLGRSLSDGTYALVATNVMDHQGNVRAETRASFRYFDPDVPAPADLVVTEILYAPPPHGTEFIEIYNRSDKTVDVGALAVADENRTFRPVAPRLTPLRPDSHTVVVRDAEAFETAFPGIDYHAPPGWDALNNGGDTVVLRHTPSETKLDAVAYAPSWGGADGHSLERLDPAGPSAAFNFGTSTADAGATPGRRNSRYDPDESAPTPLFAEQVAKQKIEVTFSEPVRASSITPQAFTLTSTSVSQATLVDDSVAVLNVSGAPAGPSLRVEAVQDRVHNTLEAASLPLALRPAPGDVALNEILFDPRTDDFDNRPNQVEYVEVHNNTPRSLTLHGLFATDQPTENGTADTLWTTRRVALPPDGYGVVAAAPTGALRPEASQLARAFPEAPLTGDSTAYLPVDAARLGLNNDGDLVRLHRADGTIIAEITYSSDWHAAGLEDPNGTALERISPTGRAAAPDNWTSTPAPAGGTPGAPNAVSLASTDGPSAPGLRIAPSPFSVERDGATRIRYTLDGVPNLVRVRIFDARGRKVRTLEDARLTGPTGELVWNGRNEAGHRVRVGVYVVLLEAVRAGEGVVSQFKAPVVVARPLN